MIAPWLPPREHSPDLERGENMPRTSPAPTHTGTTPPHKKAEPMPDWLNKEPISDAELKRWAAAHHPKKDSEDKADITDYKTNTDGSRSGVLREHMMSGGL